MTALRIGVDAANFPSDRRGMGRIGRQIVAEARKARDLQLTLLADKRADVRRLRAEFPDLRVQPSRTASQRNRFDVTWYPFNGIRFASAAPSVVIVHDVFALTRPHPDRVARWREQGPLLQTGRRATRIITGSSWSRSEIMRALGVPLERVEIVPPSPDRFFFPAAGDVLPPPLAGRKFVLIVGPRERRKNARLALEACARALRGPNELLVIVGSLDERDRTFARALQVRCSEVAASDALLRALYRHATAVLVPSTGEGFGLVAIEAMACGAPVIASDAAALPEATGGAAMLISPRDVTMTQWPSWRLISWMRPRPGTRSPGSTSTTP